MPSNTSSQRRSDSLFISAARPIRHRPDKSRNQSWPSTEPLTLVISAEEDRTLLNGFLETLYLEWAERACPSLGNQMPRHVATSAAGREQVAALIADMERHDPGIRRVGQAYSTITS